MVRIRNRVLAVLVPLLALLIVTSCADGTGRNTGEGPAVTPLAVKTATPDRDGDGIPDTSDAWPDDPSNQPKPVVTASCYTDDTYSTRLTFTIDTGKDGRPDFLAAWAAKPYSCDVTRNSAPFSDVERTAYETSGYDDNDITTLYEICTVVDEEDVYAQAGFTASPEQIGEMTGVLTLCPSHPQASAWRQAVQRGKVDADLIATGKLFGAGTFLVGKEIQPGTYFVQGEIEGCYWERQNRNGETIDNDFVSSARRVQVTIRSTDYAFHSKRCGNWRPVP